MTQQLDSAERAVDKVLESVGREIRLGLPLGLGKPNRFVNALYRRACADADIHLSIFTALSLGRPRAGSDLEKRFLEPFAERIFGDYEELDYLRDLRAGKVPANIHISEFFFQPASMLGNSLSQQHYISANYTHVARDLNRAGVNVVAQLVADPGNGELSLGCNPEVTLDLVPRLMERRRQGDRIVSLGQVHRDMPAMANDARVPTEYFDIVLDDPAGHTTLFSTPNMPVDLQDHFVGLHASSLLRDGGLIQIGIGALGDALVHHALMRDRDNTRYRDVLGAVGASSNFARLIGAEGGVEPFRHGLYGCSEMMTASLFALLKAGIIRRPVYDDLRLQLLVNEGLLGGPFDLATLDLLIARGILSSRPEQHELDWLQRYGIVSAPVAVDGDDLLLPNDVRIHRDLTDRVAREAIQDVLGKSLQGGTLMHGGFFLGPRAFYQSLRDLTAAQHASINMTRISYINHLFGGEELKRAQRRDARFFNTCFTMTLLGAAVSDQVEDGRVLSGVGGQYNFVAQAHELEGARSVLMLRSWRERGGEAASNIVWSYGHNTIPRHLRDIVVTEYGIADLRGRNDSDVIAALLNISDSRFQASLLAEAKKVGKIAADYQIPEAFRQNLPERLEQVRSQFGDSAFPMFPLGSDFTDIEQALISALAWLKHKVSQKEYLQLGRRVLADDGQGERFAEHMARMGLASPANLRERLYRRLLLTALAETAG
ncbi:MAG: acetyl-CoA hydrolase/transferase C-terminal domain-containing protein [Alcanivoracaceae bacterium]